MRIVVFDGVARWVRQGLGRREEMGVDMVLVGMDGLGVIRYGHGRDLALAL